MVLLLLGAFRGVLGYGTVFRQADLMFGEAAKHIVITFAADFDGFLFAILLPGAFMGLAVLIAVKNILDKRIQQRQAVKTQTIHTIVDNNELMPYKPCLPG